MAKNGIHKGGRPRGKKNQATLDKEAALSEYRKKIIKNVNILWQKQFHLASGQTFLYKIEKEKTIGPKGGVSYKNKKAVLVTSQTEIEMYLCKRIENGDKDDKQNPNATYYFITTKEPDGKAIDSMLDRAFGKATQPVEGSGENGEFIFKWQEQ